MCHQKVINCSEIEIKKLIIATEKNQTDFNIKEATLKNEIIELQDKLSKISESGNHDELKNRIWKLEKENIGTIESFNIFTNENQELKKQIKDFDAKVSFLQNELNLSQTQLHDKKKN